MSGKDADNMHKITELPAWESLFKRIVWKQIGEIERKRILDFGSGEGITAYYFAEKNEVIAIEPSQEMLTNAWKDYQYTQIMGDVKTLSAFADKIFDIIICLSDGTLWEVHLEQRIANASTGERVKLNKKLTALQAQDAEILTYEEEIRHLADQMISIALDDGVKKNYVIFQDVLKKIYKVVG